MAEPHRHRSWVSIVLLLVVAPLSGEFFLGSLTIRDLPALPFLVPLYGGGALLVREVARRLGGGWPTILLLGLAYGVIESGLVDGSMFAPHYGGMDLTGGRLEALGMGYWGVAFVINHAVWSIAAPIGLVEVISPGRTTRPWLGVPGTIVAALLYVGGCLMIGADQVETEGGYAASPGQVTGCLVAVVALLALAAAAARARTSGRDATPRPALVAVVTAVATGAVFVMPATILGAAALLATVVVAVLLGGLWSSDRTWTRGHTLGAVSGAWLTSAWGSFLTHGYLGRTDVLTMAGAACFVVVAAALVAYAYAAVSRPELGTGLHR